MLFLIGIVGAEFGRLVEVSPGAMNRTNLRVEVAEHSEQPLQIEVKFSGGIVLNQSRDFFEVPSRAFTGLFDPVSSLGSCCALSLDREGAVSNLMI